MSTTLEERLSVLRTTGRFPPEVLQAFASHLMEAREEAVFRMSPLRYGADHQIPERLAIDLFLHATHAGLLDFTWGVLCPACGAFITTPAALRSLNGKRCAVCEVDAPLTDQTVEVAFTVSPTVRKIRFQSVELDLRRDWATLFFSPSRIIPENIRCVMDDMVIEAHVLKPGEHLVLQHTFPRGRFALFAPGLHAWSRLEVEASEGPTDVSIDMLEGKLYPAEVELAPGPVTMRIHNRTSLPVALGIAVNHVPHPVRRGAFEAPPVELRAFLTGKQLVTSQTFRELFRAESIPSEGGLEFKSMTLLFTDLKGSTELYERIGDFRAYGVVREHFSVLKEIVARQGGALVKTIGDAVMASFPEPVPALAAAATMHREIKRVARGELELKIGLHSGPCIAVESNERLDYFGRTVNIAARAQSAAEANEIVCTDPVFLAQGAQDVVRAMSLTARRDRAVFKGVEGEVVVHRLQ